MKETTVLPFDRWRSTSDGLIVELTKIDVVFFTALVDAHAIETSLRSSAGSEKPSYTAIVVGAISSALRRHPELNRLVLPRWPFRFRPIQLHEVHAVVAVERTDVGGDRVYAGIIRNSDKKSAMELTRELHDFATRKEADDPRMRTQAFLVRRLPGHLARLIIGLPRWTPKLWLEHRGGSFALTTVGKYGVENVLVKWPWPLTFTFGEVKSRPMVVGDAVCARTSFHLTMGWRRDLCNGAPAARFFKEIVNLLEQPTLKTDGAQTRTP